VISVDEAISQLLAQSRCLAGIEQVPLAEALDRVLAEDLVSSLDVPPADNSAVDGYAVRLTDAGQRRQVLDRIVAGAVPAGLSDSGVARIFTGATVPFGAQAVVMQEDCESHGDQVLLPDAIRSGANIRRRGQDVQRGETVLQAGTVLTPWHCGLIASLGLASVAVRARLRVALLTTGSELQEPGEAPQPGKIFNSNRALLEGLLQRSGCQVVPYDIVADTAAATRDALLRASNESDLVITTGGVSVGEEDHVRDVVAQLGAIDLWKVAIKPGKPFAFGHIRSTPFIGLPGNPASVLITFLVLVRPFLDRCNGVPILPLRSYPMPADFTVSTPGRRDEYLRVRINQVGRLEAHPNQSSGMLSSACWAEGLSLVPAGKQVMPGDMLMFFPFTELLS
jgi:molybdopterin molybdotransferase